MKFRFTDTTSETYEFREYDEKNIKGGSERALEAIQSLYELKKREDADMWAMVLELVDMPYDIDWMPVTTTVAEVLA